MFIDTLKDIKEIPIPSKYNYSYNGMAFDGCNYYFSLSCIGKILKTDKHFETQEYFETYREYNCICYDFKCCCFWATSNECNNKLFKLNNQLREIDYITICGCKEAIGFITGISYNCCKDTLMVAFKLCVIEINKQLEQSVVTFKTCSQVITGICYVCPYFIITTTKDGNQYIMIFDFENQIIQKEIYSNIYNLKNIIFNPCTKHHHHYQFDILADKKGCYPYIIQTKIRKEKLDIIPCQCNENIIKYCGKKLNYKPIDACTDILESIALEEAAIANILNAEGEKLQKIIAESSDVCEILEANKSVLKTIIYATQLEQVVYKKLEALNACCSICKKESCKPNCPPEKKCTKVTPCEIDGGQFCLSRCSST